MKLLKSLICITVIFSASSAFSGELQTKLDKKRAGSKAPPKIRMTMDQATAELQNSGIIDKAKNKGQKFVDFTLPNFDGRSLTLSKELKKGPVILTFYRGGWCPYCNLQLKAYQDNLEKFKKAGAQLIAISPESADSARGTTNKNDVKFPVLTDANNQVARKYGLVFAINEDLKKVYKGFGIDLKKNQGNDSWELPIPATYVIAQDGKITYAFLNVDYVQRAEPSEILQEVIKLKK